MTIVLAALIALLIGSGLTFVLSPLFRETGTPDALTGPDEAHSARRPAPADRRFIGPDELIARRDAIYASLKDAEFDREMGKLSHDDYQVVRTRYMREAAHILRQLDQLMPEADAGLDAEIEEAVAAVRTSVAGPGEGAPDLTIPPAMAAAVEAEIASLATRSPAPDRPPAMTCPNCGRSYQAGDAFCARCGTPLSDVPNSG